MHYFNLVFRKEDAKLKVELGYCCSGDYQLLIKRGTYTAKKLETEIEYLKSLLSLNTWKDIKETYSKQSGKILVGQAGCID